MPARRPVPETTSYGREARDRLALSEVARSLSDSAAELVPTRSAEAGELVLEANGLVQLAQSVLELAVLVERQRRSSWGQIGGALGVSRQAVHERFSAAIERWLRELREPWATTADAGQLQRRFRELAADPESRALELDRWAVGRLDPSAPDVGEHPVSGNLPHATATELESMLLEELTAVTQAVGEPESTGLPSEARWTLQRRRVDLLERLAVLRPNAPAYAEAAAYARRELKRPVAAENRAGRDEAAPVARPVQRRRRQDHGE